MCTAEAGIVQKVVRGLCRNEDLVGLRERMAGAEWWGGVWGSGLVGATSLVPR